VSALYGPEGFGGASICCAASILSRSCCLSNSIWLFGNAPPNPPVSVLVIVVGDPGEYGPVERLGGGPKDAGSLRALKGVD
jgi:hypothetical protein